MGLVMLGCPQTPSSSSTSTDVSNASAPTLVLATTVEPTTLDPAFAQLSGEQEIIGFIYRGLTRFGPDWRVRPALARSLPTVNTTTTGAPIVDWTLRSTGWADGKPLTTADIVFGHQIERDPNLEAVSHQVARQVAKMEARSETSFRVFWKAPYADHWAPRVHAILPAHAYPPPRVGQPFAGAARRPLANGPFQLERWESNQWLSLVPNPHWQGPQPYLARVVVRFFPSPEPFVAELKTGGIDALGEASGLNFDQARAIAEDVALRQTHEVVFTESGVWLHVDMQLDHPGLRHREVRQALSQAIDRRAMAKVVYDGQATEAWGIFPPRHPAGGQTSTRTFDLHAARRLLSRAGYRPVTPLTLEFGSGSPASERAATFLQSQWKRLGFEIKLKALPLSVLFDKLKQGSHAHLTLYAWRIRPDWDGASALRTAGRLNYGRFSHARMDTLLTQASALMVAEERTRVLRRVETLYRHYLPSIPLLFRRQVSVRPKRLKGWAPTGTTTPVSWNAETWRYR